MYNIKTITKMPLTNDKKYDNKLIKLYRKHKNGNFMENQDNKIDSCRPHAFINRYPRYFSVNMKIFNFNILHDSFIPRSINIVFE